MLISPKKIIIVAKSKVIKSTVNINLEKKKPKLRKIEKHQVLNSKK